MLEQIVFLSENVGINWPHSDQNKILGERNDS